MRWKHLVQLVFSFLSLGLAAQEPLLINAYMRDGMSLDGQWHYIVDPYENGYYNYRYQPFDQMEKPGKSAYFTRSTADDRSELLEYDFSKAKTLSVPGDWNTQDDKLYYYEGTIWYEKTFDYPAVDPGRRYFVYFGAVNYEAEVYFNGQKLGKHTGGFTPFNYEVTDLIRNRDNFLVVKVDNSRRKEGVPTLNTDWWNYGGVTRSVKLINTPAQFVRDYMVQLDAGDPGKISGFIQLDGNVVENETVHLEIPELGIRREMITDDKGHVNFSFGVENIRYWSPSDPYLYRVKITAAADKIADEIGFRTIRTAGSNILLNGKTIFLKGICMHEESPLHDGRAHNPEDAEFLLSRVKELGGNFVRLAHYPHNEHMVRVADKMGIMVWEEIPVYWTIAWENEATYRNAQGQLEEVIHRDRNRASVIIWSMANETPNSDARMEFLSALAKTARREDPTRLISAALEISGTGPEGSVKTIEDPFADEVDVLSFNQYIGWYDGLPDKCDRIEWNIVLDKPVLISEFGGGAKAGYHADRLTRWSEEYQAYLYERSLPMLDRIPQLSGMTPWILRDFRSPRRPLPEIQEGWNRKGLIADDGQKKLAFFVLKNYYARR